MPQLSLTELQQESSLIVTQVGENRQLNVRGDPELWVGLVTREDDQGASAAAHLRKGPLKPQINHAAEIKGV